MDKINQSFDDRHLAVHVAGAVDLFGKALHVGGVEVGYRVVLEIVAEFIELNAAFDGLGVEVVFIDFIKELVAGGIIGNLVGATVFVGVGTFDGQVLLLAMAQVFNLEALLVLGTVA